MPELWSVQQRNEHVEPIIGGMSFPITFYSDDGIAPNWNASDRDSYLRSFWKRFGNDILQAFLAVSIAKVQTQNWVLEGPELLATFCQTMLRDDADFDRGWSYMIARGVQDYYTQDNGWFMERMRSEPGDYEGPCLGLSHLDSARMKPSGNEDFPYYYMSPEGEYHLMHKSQIMRIVDMPSPETSLHHHMRGFCALSRALSTAMVLTLLVAMKREKLSDLPPSALAVFNNINKRQFDSALSIHTSEQISKGNTVWKTLLPLFGIDPAHPADVKFISLREVWEGFDEMTAYNVAVYSFAAAWRMDPREVWPVSSGPLGTGKEAEVQHEKAKGKSFGLLFTDIERAFNNNRTLPKEVSFKFQLEDSEEEQLRASIHQTQIGNVKSMQEAGASLTPQEVRRLLALEYHILPRNMMNLPPEALAAMNQQPGVAGGSQPPNQISVDDVGRIPIGSSSTNAVSVDDVERQTKEYGMYFGPRIIIDSTGKTEYVNPYFQNFFAYTKEYSDSGDLIPVRDIITRIGKLPIARRKAVEQSMGQIQTVLGAEKRMQGVEAIPDVEWEPEMSKERIITATMPAITLQPQILVNISPQEAPIIPPAMVTVNVPDNTNQLMALKESLVPVINVPASEITIQPTPVVIQQQPELIAALHTLLSKVSPEALGEVLKNLAPSVVVNVPKQPVNLTVELPQKPPMHAMLHRNDMGKIESIEEVMNV